MKYLRALNASALVVASVVAFIGACVHRELKPSHVVEQHCLAPAAVAEVAPEIRARMSDPKIKKLCVELRHLLKAMAKPAATPPEPGVEPECFPETVDLIVGFRGDKADLEKAGFTFFSVGRHPDGTMTGTGRIATTRLLDLAAVEHLLIAGGGGHYLPELNVSVD